MSSACKFQGPAGSTFPSFGDQALSSLNNCCPRWNDQKVPKSYMIPPIFYFIHPEMPDDEIEEFKRAGKFDRDVIDRTSDDAEHMVFDALNMLVNEEFAAPFLALRDFNLNRISTYLRKIFPGLPPSVTSKTFGEYDYVLIGPHIGIVVIEIKSTPFTGKRDFNSSLPEQYKHGIAQLRSFDTVLDLLQQVTSICMDRSHVRRILFTPNLKRSRYEQWFNSLDEHRRKNMNERVEGIDRWFWEDTQPASPLCDKLRSCLGQSTHFMTSVAFELNAPIITGLSSVTITKEMISIDSETISMEKAAMRVSRSIETQDPSSLDPSSRRHTVPTVGLQIVELLKSIILTPEQSAALRGPSSQFIVGPAGSGKTIILQAKALETLQKGESVLVLCSDLYIGQYVNLFETHKLRGFAVKSWPKQRDTFRRHVLTTPLRHFTRLDEFAYGAGNYLEGFDGSEK